MKLWLVIVFKEPTNDGLLTKSVWRSDQTLTGAAGGFRPKPTQPNQREEEEMKTQKYLLTYYSWQFV